MTMVCCRKLSEAERAALPECRRNLRRNEKSRLNRCCACMGKNLQLFLIFAGLALGIIIGLYLREVSVFKNPEEHPREMMYFTFFSHIITQFLRFLSIPLLILSIVSGISLLTTNISGKITLSIFIYYVFTSLLATVEGFLWMYAFKPGVSKQQVTDELLNNTMTEANPDYHIHAIDILLDYFRNMFPDNFVTMNFERVESSEAWTELTPQVTGLNSTKFIDRVLLTPAYEVNLIGVTTVCVIFAFFVTKLSKKKSTLLSQLFESFYEVLLRIYVAFLWLYPLGLLLLMAKIMITLDNPGNKILTVGRFLLAVLVGQLAHVLIVIPVLFWIFTRKNPFAFFINIFKALLMAFASCDSILTLPVALECMQKHTNVNENVYRFTLPIGAIFNMNGTALYQVMLIVFFAKFRGISPGIVDLILMGAVSLILSFGAVHVRNRAILYAVLFHILKLPTDDLIILIPLEWILLRLCTMVNVWGDCVGAAIVDKLIKKDIDLLHYKNSPQYKRLKYGDDYIHNSEDEAYV